MVWLRNGINKGISAKKGADMTSSWGTIHQEVALRAKIFNSFSIEDIQLKEGIISTANIGKIESELLNHKNLTKDNFAKYWFWTFLPIIRKLIDDVCWTSLGYFEYERGKKKDGHWLYFPSSDYDESVLKTFSLIGNPDLYKKFLADKIILSYQLYKGIDKETEPNISHAQTTSIGKGIPLCLRLCEDVAIPKDWGPLQNGVFAKHAMTLDFFEQFKCLRQVNNDFINGIKIKQNTDKKTSEGEMIDDFWGSDEKEFYTKYIAAVEGRCNALETQNWSSKTNSGTFGNKPLSNLKIEDLDMKILRYLALIADSSKGKASLILTIPAWIPSKEYQKIRSVALIVCFKGNNLKKILPAVSTAMQLGSINYSLHALEFSKQEIKRHAIKSAISAIMARNGSHNIGSHVINRVVESIDSLNIQDHKYLFRYLQQRMDFVAQISTDFSQWSTPHWFVKEIMKGFYEQKHLLNYIASSEGLKGFEIDNGNDCRAEKAEVRYIIKNVDKYHCDKAKPHECFESVTNCTQCEMSDQSECKHRILVCGEDECTSDLSKDISVSVPGGLVGFHAFYTILENFIRNSAKHCYAGHPEQNRDMVVTIEMWNYEDDNEYYSVIIRDNYSFVSGYNYASCIISVCINITW